MGQGLEAHPVVFVVDVHDGQGEQQLGQAEGNRVFQSCEEAGEGSAQHVAHGDVEKRDQEHKGPDEAVLHGGQLGLHLGLRPLRLDLDRFPGLLRQGSPVARVDHRLDDAVGGEGALVVVHRHGVGHQADLRLADGIQLVDGLLYMRRARRAGHAGDVEFLLHRRSPNFFELEW